MISQFFIEQKDIFKNQIKKELQKEKCDFEGLFLNFANILMNNFTLETNDNKIYEFIELEFYLNDENKHNDPYTHNQPTQKDTNAIFYVHRKPKQRAGFGLVFGDKTYFASILIRGLKNKDFIQGPAKSLQTIFTDKDLKFSEKKYKNLEKYYELAQKYLNEKISIIDTKNQNFKIYKSQRYGLKQKEEDKNQYFKKLYRFLREDFIENYSTKIKDYKDILYFNKNLNLTLK